MTQVIAPPPAAVNQLVDLIALFRNLDMVEKWVTELQEAGAGYSSKLQELAVTNTATAAALAALARKEQELADREQAVQAREAAVAEQERVQVEGRSNLESGFANLQSRTDGFNAYQKSRQTALDNLQSQVEAAKNAADKDRAEAAELLDRARAKMAAIQAAVEG
jgi:hypothetical protein